LSEDLTNLIAGHYLEDTIKKLKFVYAEEESSIILIS